jgi:hypothetical protein
LPRARAKRISYRTIFAETDWRNLANASVPESLNYPNDGQGKDKDSVGLYQQRARWWGTTMGSMDPYIATTRFLDRMLQNAPSWFTTDEAEVAQMVQGSQYDGVTIDPVTRKPYPFAQNYRDRDAQTAAMERDLSYYGNGGK